MSATQTSPKTGGRLDRVNSGPATALIAVSKIAVLGFAAVIVVIGEFLLTFGDCDGDGSCDGPSIVAVLVVALPSLLLLAGALMPRTAPSVLAVPVYVCCAAFVGLAGFVLGAVVFNDHGLPLGLLGGLAVAGAGLLGALGFALAIARNVEHRSSRRPT